MENVLKFEVNGDTFLIKEYPSDLGKAMAIGLLDRERLKDYVLIGLLNKNTNDDINNKIEELGIKFQHQLADPFDSACIDEDDSIKQVDEWNNSWDIEHTYLFKKINHVSEK